jgi:transcription-repair coupling factor (superfamily II helicase)
MYEKAPINPIRIPQLLDVNKPYLKFTADAQNPYFTYVMNANSREKGKDVVEILKNLLEMMQFLQENA